MKKLLLMSLFIPQIIYCSCVQKPISPQAQRDAKSRAEAGTQTSAATERWHSAKWQVLAEFRRAKLQHFMKPVVDKSVESLQLRIGQLELDLAQRTKERDQLNHAFERAKELKTEVATKEHTIKLLQIQNRKLVTENKTLINQLSAKSRDELP